MLSSVIMYIAIETHDWFHFVEFIFLGNIQFVLRMMMNWCGFGGQYQFFRFLLKSFLLRRIYVRIANYIIYSDTRHVLYKIRWWRLFLGRLLSRHPALRLMVEVNCSNQMLIDQTDSLLCSHRNCSIRFNYNALGALNCIRMSHQF